MKSKFWQVEYNKNINGKLFNSYFLEYPDCNNFVTDLLNLGYQKIFVYEVTKDKNLYSFEMINSFLSK